MIYDIFAGLGGGYGGAVWMSTEDHPNEDSANESARAYALETWESYGEIEGVDGYTWEDYVAEVGEENADDDEFARINEEAFDSWADYYVVAVPNADENYEYDGPLK